MQMETTDHTNTLERASTPPLIPSVAPILDQYQRLLGQHVPDLLSAFYLHGSIGLGAFCEGQSDIDFLAILSQVARNDDVHTLAQIHKRIATAYPGCAMEGSYLQWYDLGHPAQEIRPYPCYHDGHMHPAARHDISPVTWWMLKHHAVTIFGPEPSALAYDICWEDVRAYMRSNFNTYWASFTTSPRRFLWLLSDAGVQWAVLGISRLLYGLQQGGMISKTRAGEYTLTQVPRTWHPLIREALNLRSGLGPRTYKSALSRARDTVAYLKYIIAHTPA
jgi:hypothetical protein